MTLYCSFCGKSQHEVVKLIAGPQCFICNECVDLCNDIIREGKYPRDMVPGDIGLPDTARPEAAESSWGNDIAERLNDDRFSGQEAMRAAAAVEILRLRAALRPILNYPGMREYVGRVLYEAGEAALEGRAPEPSRARAFADQLSRHTCNGR